MAEQDKTHKDNRDIGCWGAIISSLLSRFILVPIGMSISETVGIFLAVICTIGVVWLLVWGCYNWAKLKNRSGTWALFGIIAPLGFIPLMLLKTKGGK